MGLGTLLKKVFGAADDNQNDSDKLGDAIEYKGYQIFLKPRPMGGQFGVGGVIRKVTDGETREHIFIRADQAPSQSQCNEITLQKAKSAIDSLGDSLFNG